MNRLLVVDDEQRILDGLENLLFVKAPDWDPTFVVDPLEAADRLVNERFDALLTDMRMPGMDGALVLEHARTVQPGTVRIALTGEVDATTARVAVPCSHRFLSKPCPSSKLLGTLDWVRTILRSDTTATYLPVAGRMTALPALASTMATVGDLLMAEASLDELTTAISADLGVSISVLRWANSGYLDGASTSSVRVAVGRLRAHWLHVAVATTPIATTEPAERRVRELNDRTTAAAATADPADADLALALRVRDLGREALRAEARSDSGDLDDHQLTALLLRLWDLPEVVAAAVEHQDDPGATEGRARELAERLRTRPARPMPDTDHLNGDHRS
jgi:CheY-like chemotaxis protein